MSAVNRDSALSYVRRRSASSRTSADNSPAQESAPPGNHMGTVRPTPSHAPSSYDPTQVKATDTQLPARSSPETSRHDRPQSNARASSVSPSRPPSSSDDAPTTKQCPSAAPDRLTSAPSPQSPPQRRRNSTLHVNVNVGLHLHSQGTTPTSTPPSSAAPPRAPGEDPDSYHVRATYAALDIQGVRGDGYEDGEELTRARLGSNRSLVQLPRSPAPSLPGEELTVAEKEILSHADRYVRATPFHSIHPGNTAERIYSQG
jgi:hypothetical protein